MNGTPDGPGPGIYYKIDLYSDKGINLKSNVDIKCLNPLKNKAIKKIVHDTKRTAAVDLAGIDKALARGKYGGKSQKIPGRTLSLDVVKNGDNIAAKAADRLKLFSGDDTNVKSINDGKQMLVQVPSARFKAGLKYKPSILIAGMATVQAIIDTFDMSMFNVEEVITAVMGPRPLTLELVGGNVKTILENPHNFEDLGHSLRNIVTVTNKNALNASALSSIYDKTGLFERGNVFGSFEREQLLNFAYQGLNANNLVYDTVKKNGATGTLGTVAHSIVEQAIEDGVISPDKKLGSGYSIFKANDIPLWNAYSAAGTLAATIVNFSLSKQPKPISSTAQFYNDLIKKETGLPYYGWGKVQGTEIGFSFFSHSIYGGGGPSVFNGNHVVPRRSRGFAIPCVAAAVSFDKGVEMFTPEMTSTMVGKVFGSIKEFREPIKTVASSIME